MGDSSHSNHIHSKKKTKHTNKQTRGMTSVPLDALESLSHIHSTAFITQSWHPALNAKARTVEEASCHAGESRPTAPTAGGQCNSCKYDVQCSYRSIGGIADWTVLVLVPEQCEDDTWKNPLFIASPGVWCVIEKPWDILYSIARHWSKGIIIMAFKNKNLHIQHRILDWICFGD